MATLGCSAGLALFAVIRPEFAAHNDGLGRVLGACLYGAALSLVGTMLASRSFARASGAVLKPGPSELAMLPIYSGLISKLLIVGGGIGFGLMALRLDAVLVVTAYIIVQFSSAWAIFKPDAQRLL